VLYEADYVIIGTGALGMNVADVLLDDTDADILMIDRHGAPGGHWNDAYPFVRLHQPACFYGVTSRKLGTDRLDEAGSNKGFFALPSGAEVSAYFDLVMRERFLPSGRVKYLPLHEYVWTRSTATCLLSGVSTEVCAKRKIIDTTFLNTTVPSTHKPAFEMENGIHLIPPNDLPVQAAGYGKFTLIGGGKTAMDTAVWLIENGADRDQLRWIVPRDSWLLNRDVTQPGDDFYYARAGAFASTLEACAESRTVDELFQGLEKRSVMLRVDNNVQPTMFRGATISRGEVKLLRQIEDVVRMGRVKKIAKNRIYLDHGEIATSPDQLYIDCTAKAFLARDPEPIFTPDRILIQTVELGNLCLSAAIIAHVEANYHGDEEKNDLCVPLPLVDRLDDLAVNYYLGARNRSRWAKEEKLSSWIKQNRLSGFGSQKGTENNPDPEYVAIIDRIKKAAPSANQNLEKLVDESQAASR
jgi:hypothetical protein